MLVGNYYTCSVAFKISTARSFLSRPSTGRRKRKMLHGLVVVIADPILQTKKT
jgi:hypothetical protein